MSLCSCANSMHRLSKQPIHTPIQARVLPRNWILPSLRNATQFEAEPNQAVFTTAVIIDTRIQQKNALEYYMDQDQRQQVIQYILEDAFFRISLREELQTIVDNTISKPTLSTAIIPIILEDIMEHLTLLINFKIKQLINQQYTSLADSFLTFTRELESIKQRLGKVEIDERPSRIQQFKPPFAKLGRLDSPISSVDLQRQNPKSTTYIQGQSPLQLAKIRYQIESIKESLAKLSAKNILEFVSENIQQINQRLNAKYQKLCHSIKQVSIKNTSIMNEESTHSAELKCESMQTKINALIQRFDSFEGIMSERYQTNFKNVWNVITDMGGTIATLKKEREKGGAKEKENQGKKGIASFLGWNS